MMRLTSSRSVLARRDLLKVGSGAVVVGAALPGCDALSTEPAGGNDDQDSDQGTGAEAPQFARRVRDDDLPPVDQRLPENPLVVETTEEEGVYGGQWATALSVEEGVAHGDTGAGYIMPYIGYEPLVRWDTEWEDVIPNIAESFEFNDDGTEYTFRLRKGIKWSDGESFTSDDLVFAYEDVMNNAELSPAGPPEFLVSGEPGELQRVDEHTVKFVFSEPNGLFLQNLATP